ncbi:cytochrome c/FTR1 family iron permease [Aquabacterium sp. J223]|uniref:cytochrome c/FTR1 family iron permease n=1 Tax=Aquabacterium sp. J223 TaxID=2898431 RepID=UPI0021ADE93D|nr:cytochrome c/FTR1 family iron permease [Aquabacterium sp. J223]UUX94464.1 cytochrome c/FTR1 family iron permease [Aquabacterium sp. J223]
MRRALQGLWWAWMFCLAWPAMAAPHDDTVRQVWQLLDYVGVDYAGAVADGKVISEPEYDEMREFSQRAQDGISGLPATPQQPALVAQAAALRQAIAARQAPDQVADRAQQLAAALLQAYPIPMAPRRPPDLPRGAALYAQQCASCHGATGAGDGPAAARLDPPPVAFTDRERASQRSLQSLYQSITQGVAGTSMPAFAALSEDDRWALAFFAGTLSHDAAMRARGAQLAKTLPAAQRPADLAALAAASERSLAPALGAEPARDLLAHLRAQPQAVAAGTPQGTALARRRLQQSLAALQAGDRGGAMKQALSAYLDGFEPVEPALRVRHAELLAAVEEGMLAYRSAVGRGDAAEAAAGVQRLDELLRRADEALDAGRGDTWSVFLGAMTILLREGAEALLVVIGILAFLRKAERHEALPYVHAGWISALAAGGLTWVAATTLVDISGASREITEGVAALVAAAVLLGVGVWMHHQSAAGRWQAYLRDTLAAALSRRSAWALFTLAFVAVYREVFETVLFYSALWVEGSGQALLAGLAAGVVLLALLAWALLRTSARLPIGRFFAWSSALIAVLAVVLAGKGVAALQEAGWFDVTPWASLPRLDWLGLFPTRETVVAQLTVVLVVLVGYGLNLRRRAPAVEAA